MREKSSEERQLDQLFEWKPAVYQLLGDPVPKLLKPLAGEFNAALKSAEDAGEKSQEWMKAAYGWREKAERWEKEAERLRAEHRGAEDGGEGPAENAARWRRAAVREDLRGHPNFELSPPTEDETAIAYALRTAAHLLSPPKVDDEDEAIACEDAAASVLGLKDDLERLWQAKE